MELTIIITAVIVAIVAIIIANEFKKRNQGKCTCGGSCGSCGMNCSCNSAEK